MPAANESQGLKIAVAGLITLAVVLAVATYFSYSSYSDTSAKLAEAITAKNTADGSARTALESLTKLRDRAGYSKAGEDYAAIEDAIKKDDARLAESLAGIQANVKGMIDTYQQAGGNQQKIQELTQAADQLFAQIQSEPNRTFQSSLTRLTELVDNMAQLTTSMSLDNADLRKNLGSVDQTNAAQVQVQVDEAKKAKDDLAAEHARHEQERSGLLQRYDDLQTRSNQQATEIARLTQSIEQMKADNDKRQGELLAQLRGLRMEVEKREDVMDSPDGRIQFVDYGRGEVRTNITRAMGAQPRLQLSVFDRNAPGLSSDKPKGLIELIQVGEQGSIARIVRTTKPSEPLRVNDQIYSAAWSPNRPKRFGLIGKIDMNRDGVDDRGDLKRLIESSGGVIDYDLPPTGVGKEIGRMTGETTYYVVDDLPPFRAPQGRSVDAVVDDSAYLARRTEVLKEAHLSGVRPIALERLLAQLGYKMGAEIPGQVEAINRDATRELLNPRGRTNVPAPTPDAGDTPPAPAEAPAP
jgi:hypothetical protein